MVAVAQVVRNGGTEVAASVLAVKVVFLAVAVVVTIVVVVVVVAVAVVAVVVEVVAFAPGGTRAGGAGWRLIFPSIVGCTQFLLSSAASHDASVHGRLAGSEARVRRVVYSR